MFIIFQCFICLAVPVLHGYFISTYVSFIFKNDFLFLFLSSVSTSDFWSWFTFVTNGHFSVDLLPVFLFFILIYVSFLNVKFGGISSISAKVFFWFMLIFIPIGETLFFTEVTSLFAFSFFHRVCHSSSLALCMIECLFSSYHFPRRYHASMCSDCFPFMFSFRIFYQAVCFFHVDSFVSIFYYIIILSIVFFIITLYFHTNFIGLEYSSHTICSAYWDSCINFNMNYYREFMCTSSFWVC